MCDSCFANAFLSYTLSLSLSFSFTHTHNTLLLYLRSLSHTLSPSPSFSLSHTLTTHAACYGVATISKLLEILGLFCKKAL